MPAGEPRDEPRRPGRSDARQNYQRLLAAAAEVFAEQGTEASVEDVARRADVGVGTLYRHFPTRFDLVEALLSRRYDELTLRAHDLLTADDAGEALVSWMRDFVTHVSAFRGLAVSAKLSMTHSQESPTPMSFSCQAMRAAAAALLNRAQRAGKVRPDVSVSEILQLTNAIAWTTDQNRVASDRFLALVTGGLAVQAAS
jgi:AcrR family transcriptional regulator